jgi:hypothetical protein
VNLILTQVTPSLHRTADWRWLIERKREDGWQVTELGQLRKSGLGSLHEAKRWLQAWLEGKAGAR